MYKDRPPKAQDFYSDQPPVRLIGVETEYSVQIPDIYTVDTIIKSVKKQGLVYSHTFCSNGAKILQDIGNVEYATPECHGPRQAAAADHAGMLVIAQMAEDHMAELGLAYGDEYNNVFGKVCLPPMRIAGAYLSQPEGQHSIDTVGYHENLLTTVPRTESQLQLLLKFVSSYLSTRSVWNGCGLVTDSYLLSQKCPGIGVPVSADTYSGDRTKHGEKPMGLFHTGNSGWGDDKVSGAYALLEVRDAESHMTRQGTFMSLAATSAITRLFELGYISGSNANDFIIQDPVQIEKDMNKSMGNVTCTLENGRTITGVELQKKLFEAVLALQHKVELPDDEIYAVTHLLETCELYEKAMTDPETDFKDLALHVEWAAKYYLLRKLADRRQKPLSLHESIAFDRRWHTMKYDKADSYKMHHKIDPMFDELEPEVQALRSSAPSQTRANIRSKLLMNQSCYDIKWNSLILSETKQKLRFDNPYVFDNEAA